MAIPEWLASVATTEDDKGQWECEHDRYVLFCHDCREAAITAYRDADIMGKLFTDHVNKFKPVVKSTGEALPPKEPYMVFRAQDKLAPVALRAYMNALIQEGIEGEPIGHMQEHILEFMAWPYQKLPH